MEDKKLDTASLLTSLILIGIGTLFLLDRLRAADFGDLIRSYWPMFIILFGVSKLTERRSIWAGLWLIAVGAWLQIAHLHLFGLTFRTSWPIMLILLGIGITLRTVIETIAEPEEEAPLTPTLSPRAGRGSSESRDPSSREAGRGLREVPREGPRHER